MTRLVKMLLCAFFIFTFFSCDKEISSEDLQVHYSGSFPLKDLLFDGEDWLAVGGEFFQSGVLVNGNLTSEESSIDIISESCINSITQQANTSSSPVYYTAGVYSYGAFRNGSWNISFEPNPFLLKETIQSNGYLFAVGGAGLSSGIVYALTSDLVILDKKNFDNDLYFVREIGGKIYAGGFGLLMFAEIDDGPFLQWKIIDEYEDHWLDIAEAEDFGIVALGASGRIIRSSNDGVTWEELLTPTLAGVSDFKDMLIYEDKIYLACGENICASDLENIDFQTILLNGVGEINRLIGNNDRIYFVTNNGMMSSIVR